MCVYAYVYMVYVCVVFSSRCSIVVASRLRVSILQVDMLATCSSLLSRPLLVEFFVLVYFDGFGFGHRHGVALNRNEVVSG